MMMMMMMIMIKIVIVIIITIIIMIIILLRLPPPVLNCPFHRLLIPKTLPSCRSFESMYSLVFVVFKLKTFEECLFGPKALRGFRKKR